MNTPNPNPLGMPQVTAENVVDALVALSIALVLAVVVPHLVKAVLRWRGRGPSSAEVSARRLSAWALVCVGLDLVLDTAPGAASTGMTRRDLGDRRRRGRM